MKKKVEQNVRSTLSFSLSFLWALLGSNQVPPDYESDALTEWAKGPRRAANLEKYFETTNS